MKNVLLSWSSGKDSAWALHVLSQNPDIRVAALLTTFNRAADRVAMHAVRRSLVKAQADRAGLPLWEAELPSPCSNAEYEDIRAYREQQLAATGLEPLFPIWGLDTAQLARDMIAGGVKAKLTCVDPRKLDGSFAGCDFDPVFLERLPQGVDPCGENGEFHTFVSDAPGFSRPIAIEAGVIVERDGFVFADFLGSEIAIRG